MMLSVSTPENRLALVLWEIGTEHKKIARC